MPIFLERNKALLRCGTAALAAFTLCPRLLTVPAGFVSVLADVGWGTHSRYVEFSTPYGGFYPVTQDGLYQSQKRFGAYRFHIADPIRFAENLRVTIQALGWRDGGRYLPLQDDIASVAFWYQTLPTAPFPALPDREFLEII